jgi:uncharacterized coiled-coil DUF342 family protein
VLAESAAQISPVVSFQEVEKNQKLAGERDDLSQAVQERDAQFAQLKKERDERYGQFPS